MKRSPREIEHDLHKLKEETPDPGGEDVDISVEWRDADPEDRPEGMAWDADEGCLRYDFWAAQWDALDALSEDVDLVALLGGYRSGKSVAGARWLLTQALRYPGIRCLAMGVDYAKATGSTYRVLFEQLPPVDVRTDLITSAVTGPERSPLVDDYHRGEHRLVLSNGSVVKLGSADTWARHAGDEYSAVWLDEPSHYNDLHAILEMIGSRLTGSEGPKKQFWTLTGNGHNAAFDILERNEDAEGSPIGLGIDVTTASVLENPYLAPEDVQRLERQFGGTSREGQALYGGFTASTGALLKFDQLQFVDYDAIADKDHSRFKYHVGIDLAYVSSKRHAEATDSDYTALVLVGVDRADEQAYVVDVARERGLSMRESIAWVRNCIGEVPAPHIKVEDVGAQTYWIQEASRELPGTVVPVKPKGSKEDRIRDMSVLFERGDCVLLNRASDEGLGYDPALRPFVREWVQFGAASDDSPDLLDAAYYALQEAQIRDASANYTILSAHPWGRDR